jgi:hypothetical protein
MNEAKPGARMKQSAIRESLDSVLRHPGHNVCSFISRGNGSSTERGFSNPREYADKNVRAPLNSELRAHRGENACLLFIVNKGV